jgi:hypothetical protein
MQAAMAAPKEERLRAGSKRMAVPQAAQRQVMDQVAAAPVAPRAPGGADAEKRPAKPLGELLAGSYDSAAQGVKVGDLFSYEPKEKVSISRGEAAMVPILSKQISGRRSGFTRRLSQDYQCFVVQNATDYLEAPGHFQR